MLTQRSRNSRSRHQSQSASIHNLDDDSLLSIFYLCRPPVFDEDEDNYIRFIPIGGWSHERWWYKCVQVCQRWRYLILRSPSHLGLCLLCTHGTPVADMLAHSPPLPLIIDHWPVDKDRDLTAYDEEGIILALQHRDRVRHISLKVPVPNLQRLVTAIDDEFPVLESLYIRPPIQENMNLTLPTTLEAPNLRHLVLYHFRSPVGSPLLATALGLVTLSICWIHPFTYLPPNDLLRQLSHMPQLETFEFSFLSPAPNRGVERQLLERPITTHVILRNLRQFGFGGADAYLEALLPHMTTPLLERFTANFFDKQIFSVPHLLQFMRSLENFTFGRATLVFFSEAVLIKLSSRTGIQRIFRISVSHLHFDWQISSVAQILNVLSPVLSAVMEVTLVYDEHILPTNEKNPILWHQLLMPFINVETLRVDGGLVWQLSHYLRMDSKPTLEPLPKLKEIVCPTESSDDGTFAPFVHQREVAGKPVRLVGKTFPVGRSRHVYHYPDGDIYIRGS